MNRWTFAIPLALAACGGSAFTSEPAADLPDAGSSAPPDAAPLMASPSEASSPGTPDSSSDVPTPAVDAGASDSPNASDHEGHASTDAAVDVLEELAQEHDAAGVDVASHDAGADVDAAKPTQVCETNVTLLCASPFFYACSGSLCCEQPCN